MRKGRPKKRILIPDPKFNDQLVTQFVNNMMFSGKKNRPDALPMIQAKPVAPS